MRGVHAAGRLSRLPIGANLYEARVTDEAVKYSCPGCGHQRTPARCWNCDVGDSEERAGLLDLAVLAVATTAIQPFVSALAARTGEEVWPKIARLVRVRRRGGTTTRLAEADVLRVVTEDGRLTIWMPKRLPHEDARALRDLVSTLDKVNRRFVISWDAVSETWEIADSDEDAPGGSPDD